MPLLKITVFGISRSEGQELERSLSGIDGVDEVLMHNSMDDLEPGVIYASALHITYLVSILAGAAGAGAAKEIGKDIYLAAKGRVQRHIDELVEEKNRETPERIHMFLSDEEELFVSGRKKQQRVGPPK